MNNKLIAPFLSFSILLITSFTALLKGIDQHQVWRIWLAGISLCLNSAFIALIIIYNVKTGKAALVKTK